jgi:hypothetical protein
MQHWLLHSAVSCSLPVRRSMQLLTPIHAPYWRFLIALVVWPIITGVPALLVALVIAVVLALTTDIIKHRS